MTTATVFLMAGGLAQAQQSAPSPNDPAKSDKQSQTKSPDDPAKSGTQSQTTQPGAGSSAGATSPSLDQSTLHEIKDETAMVQELNLTAGELEGMKILGADGEEIGSVNKALADSSNEVKAVTVDVGGFLGIGSREVVIPVDQLQKGTEDDSLQTTMTKAGIEALEEWEETDRGMQRSK